jgi:hypothetical protein
MGAIGAKGVPNQRLHAPMSLHELSPHHHGLNGMNLPKPVIRGQRTLPISGAPRVPANPLLAMCRRAHKR